MNIELPSYKDEDLQSYTEQQLIELMIQNEDRVPRNVIDECASRGDKMIEALAPMANPAEELEQEKPGRWWIRLHALMILGLIPSEKAGLQLLTYIDYMEQEPEGDLQDWVAGYWPALTSNKPSSVIQMLGELCEDRHRDWYIRINITEAVIADAYRQGEQDLEKALDWLANIVGNEKEDWDFRLMAANTLLDFPRERFKDLLLELASQQSGIEAVFNKKDVNRSYNEKTDKLGWENGRSLWDFYKTNEIEARQKRWEQEAKWELEDELGAFDDPFDSHEAHQGWSVQQPIQRDSPKVGRNDPCPCGSGKKYKKCCLH